MGSRKHIGTLLVPPKRKGNWARPSTTPRKNCRPEGCCGRLSYPSLRL